MQPVGHAAPMPRVALENECRCAMWRGVSGGGHGGRDAVTRRSGIAMAEQKLDDDTANDIDLLHDLIGRALRQGADAADAVMFEGISLSHARRLGKTEKLERSESRDLGLRVLIG